MDFSALYAENIAMQYSILPHSLHCNLSSSQTFCAHKKKKNKCHVGSLADMQINYILSTTGRPVNKNNLYATVKL